MMACFLKTRILIDKSFTLLEHLPNTSCGNSKEMKEDMVLFEEVNLILMGEERIASSNMQRDKIYRGAKPGM